MKNNHTIGIENNTARPGRSGLPVAALLIILLGLIIYLPAAGAPFVFDDEVNIIRNSRLHDLANFWPPLGSRYLAHLSFALNYAMGGLHTTGYHLVNITIHILSAITLYGLVKGLFATPAMMGLPGAAERGINSESDHLGHYTALITALIFTAHPLNTQAVLYITQRFTCMAALFYLLSLYLYIRWRNLEQGSLRAVLYIFSILAAVAASKTKEISFTLPFVILLTEYVFFTETGKRPDKKRLYTLIPYALVLFIIPLSILGPELGLWSGASVVDNGLTRTQQIVDLKELSSYTYLMTQFTVVPKYIRLFFLPISQNLDYDYPLYHSFFNIRVMAGFVLLLIIFAWAVLAARSAKRGRRPLLLAASAGVLWFFITLSIESTVIPIHDVIFEHRMYLPGCGLGLALAAIIVYLATKWKKKAPRNTLIIITLIIITPLTALALKRAMLWRDGIKLYEDVVRKSPNKARAHNNLGALYVKKGDLDKAVTEFRKTIDLDPSFIRPYKNLADALYKKGDMKKAASALRSAVKIYSEDYEIHYALASIYRQGGLIAKSEKEYKIVTSLMPSNTKARMSLAKIYISRGRFKEAASQYKKILETEPDMVILYFNIGLALEKAEETDEALYYYRKFIDLTPDNLGDVREKVLQRIGELSPKKR